ncbi:hypothetical protein J0A68_18035 [Algoriphagus sp. H41]|uniref:Uncharacterized protein n=1 Tax=Algoriphagus oliviformis TaxID=2811231 RepID=A0ABS3C8H5_9BACT|nr:hypothetical protein [Algoriphagus oliviformis]MBN7812861.1 hypothetical protein [Algoriphagus oliviformis]
MKIKILYRGKLPSSDPLLILKEARLKLSQQPTPLSIDFDFENNWNQRVELIKGKNPNSIASFRQGSNKYKVSRYVTKEGGARLSLYAIACDEEIFAVFCRLYDFGKCFSEIEQQAAAELGGKRVGSYMISKNGYGVLLDSLGQSQAFLWNNGEALDKCFSSLQS